VIRLSFLDKAKDALEKVEDLAKDNPDKVEAGIDKAKDLISDKTGGKFDSQIDAAAEKATDALGL
jgi:hypothetical protein